MTASFLSPAVAGVLHQVAVAASAPDDNKVVAGGTGALVFILLILAVIFLCRSLVTRLRNVDQAEDEGRYDPSTKKDVHQKIPRGLGAEKPPIRP